MKILALDTSTEACSAALMIDGEMTTHYQLAPREHSRLILTMIDDLLTQAGLSISEIEAIAFGRGPGSFMGLRIAAGVVQGIAFAYDIPVIPVSTLKAIAQRVYDETQIKKILVAIDARMDEVYCAAYSLEDKQWLRYGEEQVISPDKLVMPEVNQSWAGAGSGWGSYQERLLLSLNGPLQMILPACFPAAEGIVKLAAKEFASGNTVPAALAIPVYLRNNVAKKPKPVLL